MMNMNTANPDSALIKTGPVKVSVIMVTYNHQHYIEQAITSILSQQFQERFELIIGDDCSTDGTSDIVRRFHAQNPETITLVSSAQNVGADANFKRCIRAARGEFIAFCEGDDYWHSPEKLRKQITVLETQDSVGAVHSDFSHTRLLNEKWKVLPTFNRQHRKKIPHGAVFENLLSGNFIQTCTLCTRSRLVIDFLDCELPIDSYHVGDWPLYLHIASTHEIAYIDEALATYRLTPTSITNKGHESDIARAENSMKMITDFCRAYSVSPAVENNAHKAALAHIVRKCTLVRNDLKFHHYWKLFLETRPEYRTILFFRLENFAYNNPVLRNIYLAYSGIRNYLFLRLLYR